MASVTTHYERSDAWNLVHAGLERLAPDGRPLDVDELAGFDHFHTAGPLATARMAELLSPTAADTVLDAGCGLGGPARHLAQRFGCRVVGVDLTPMFVDIGRVLNERTGLTDLVRLQVGDVTALALSDGSVDHAWTQHVAMNIADRPRFYGEVRRVLRTGGRFAMFDVIDGGGGELLLPVPWATEAAHNHLVTRDRQNELLARAGFRIDLDEDPTDELLATMQQMLTSPGTSPLTTALFIDDLETKGPMYLRNLEEQRTALSLVVGTAI